MKILLLIPELSGGGAERQVGYLSRELLSRGHEVLIGYRQRGAGQGPESIPTVQLHTCYSWDPRFLAGLFRLIRSWKPDVIQTCVTPMDVAGGIAAAAAGVPFIIREASSSECHKGIKSELRLLVARAAASAIVANSRVGEAYWSERAPNVPRYRIPNAVPVEAIENSTPIPRPRDAVVGVYVGRLVREKNIDVAIRACAAVAAERELLLYVCGEGPDRARLGALAEELGISPHVHFTGFVPDSWRYQRGADFALLLSDFEGHPNAVAESFAARTPMVLSDIRAHRDLVAGEDVVLSVPVRNVGAAAHAIRKVLDDRPAALERAHRAHRSVAKWSVADMTAAYEAVYRDVISRSAHSARRDRVPIV